MQDPNIIIPSTKRKPTIKFGTVVAGSDRRRIGKRVSYVELPPGSAMRTALDPDEEVSRRQREDAPKPKKALPARWGNTIETHDPKFHWYPYLPEDELTLLIAPPKVGKGLIGASFAAAVSTGGLWPDGTQRATEGRVLWLETEDRVDAVVVPRLIAAGAKMRNIALLQDTYATPQQLADFIKAHRAKMLVLSPLKSYLPPGTKMNDEMAVRRALEDLHRPLKGLGCAVIGLMHPNKKTDSGQSAMDRAAGSGAFTQYARNALLGRRDENTGERRMAHGWTNLGKEGDDLLFSINWVGDPRLKAHQQNPQSQFVRVDWRKADTHADTNSFFELTKRGGKATAADWLKAWLKDKGAVDKHEVIREGQQAGYTESALRAAFSKGITDGLFHSTQAGFGAEKHAVWGLNLPGVGE